MAEPVNQSKFPVRLIKLVSLIVSLMFLINTVKSFNFGDNLNKYKETFQTALEQAVGYEQQKQDRIESISRLLKQAKSITNKQQLEGFMENLEEHLDEVRQQKISDRARIAAAVQQFNLKMQELNPKLQQLKMMQGSKPGEDQIMDASEQLLESGRTYLTLKKNVLAAEGKDMGERLNGVISALKRSQGERHEEL